MKVSRLAVVTLAALMFFGVPGVSTATNTSGVTAAINHAVAEFNQGNMKGWVAACASSAAIIDDFPPHTWQGPNACGDWASAFTANMKQNGITGGMVTLGTAWHVTVTGAHAYAVYPATYTYKQHGKSMKDSGTFALVLQQTSGGWLIAAWSWAAH